MTRIAVSAEVLKWAIGRVPHRRGHLQERFPRLGDWVAGTVQPTLRQLEAFARATATPLGYLFLEVPPVERLPVPHFRTVDGDAPTRPSADLLDSIYLMERRQAWAREFLREQGAEELPFVGSARPSEPVPTIASYMRKALGLEELWASEHPTWEHALNALRESMEGAGILVATSGIVGNNTRRALDVGEFRGFVLVDEYAPLVFVNGRDAKAAQMFTLAHELAHVFLGKSAVFDLDATHPADDPVERLCNRVAAEFLVPERALRSSWPAVDNEPDPFQAIASRFKVSELVAARRALDLGLISRDHFLRFYREYLARTQRMGEGQDNGGDFYVNQTRRIGRRFFSLVLQAAREGRLLYSEAYKLTQLYGQSFERYAAFLETGRPQG